MKVMHGYSRHCTDMIGVEMNRGVVPAECVHLENGMTWNDSQRVAQAPQLQIGGCLFHWLQSC